MQGCLKWGNYIYLPGKGGNKALRGCSGYTEYNATAPVQGGKLGNPKIPGVSDVLCPKCGKKMVRRKKGGKAGYDFFGCSGFPKCDGIL